MFKSLFEKIQSAFIPPRMAEQLSFTPHFRVQVFFWVNLSTLFLISPSFMQQIFWESWGGAAHKTVLFTIYLQVILVLLGIFWFTRYLSAAIFNSWVVFAAMLEVCTVTAALFVFAYLAGSFYSSAFFWLPLMPVTMSYFTRPRYGVFLAIACVFTLTHFYYYFYIIGNVNTSFLEAHAKSGIHYFDAFSALFLAAFLGWIYETTKRRLQRKITETQAEVERQREKLFQSAKFHSLGEMAASLAHEVNNPLFMVQGKVHSMRNLVRKQDFDRSKYDQLVDEIETIIMGLSQVARGVSQFARNEDKEEMVQVSLNKVIEDTIMFSRERFKELAVEVKTDLEQEVVLYCHPVFISQILLNLLNNAVDAVVECKKERNIWVRLFEIKEKVILEVEDSGKGVNLVDMDKIFDPFFTNKSFGRGTGLGLSISRSLAQEHRGDLFCKNDGHIGAVFQLCLPASLKDSPEPV